METWKILLITLLAAVAIGSIIGVLVGKHQVKKAQSGRKPLLSVKERIIFSALILAGVACILVGNFYTLPSQNEGVIDGDEMINGDELLVNEKADNGVVADGAGGGGVVVRPARNGDGIAIMSKG